MSEIKPEGGAADQGIEESPRNKLHDKSIQALREGDLNVQDLSDDALEYANEHLFDDAPAADLSDFSPDDENSWRVELSDKVEDEIEKRKKHGRRKAEVIKMYQDTFNANGIQFAVEPPKNEAGYVTSDMYEAYFPQAGKGLIISTDKELAKKVFEEGARIALLPENRDSPKKVCKELRIKFNLQETY